MKQGPEKDISMQNNAQEKTKPYEIWIEKINDYETVFLKKCSGLIEHFLNNQENAEKFVNPDHIKAIEAAVKGVIDNFPKEVIERE